MTIPAGARDERGFTLMELLIVIVIMGILSAVVVFSVGGISNKGQGAACASERSALETAEEAAYASTGNYLDAAGLEGKFIHSAPSHHTIELSGGTFTIVPDATCAASLLELASAGGGTVPTGATSTTAAPASTTSTTAAPATTTSTTAPPATTTTTTVPPTTTTTAPAPVTNGVSVVASANSSDPYYGESRLQLTNTSAVLELTVTIRENRTTGLGLNGQYNTFQGGNVSQSNSVTASAITYTFTLLNGKNITPGTWNLVGQHSGNGTPHPTTGDTWTVTSKSQGKTVTLSGHF